MRIDAHQHFWHYTDQEFGWINDAMSAIRTDFLPSDLHPLMQQASIDATIAVQARQSLRETEWLLQLSREHAWIAGVVGWLPLTDANVESLLDSFSAGSKLKGVRHVLQGEQDAYMDRDDFNSGIALLRKFSLAYDVLVAERQLPAAIRFVDRHPSQLFVLDHIAKPLIAAQQLEPWSTHIQELARRPHVVCKLSGMVTEASFDRWTEQDLRPYVETVLEAFGPKRLLFGSDWPVCTVAASYTRWAALVAEFLATLSAAEQAAIFGTNTARTYRVA